MSRWIPGMWLVLATTAGAQGLSPASSAALVRAPLSGATSGDRASAELAAPDRNYFVYVVSESADQVALVRFGPDGLNVVRRKQVGMMPTELNGPHGVSVAPDGKHYYVSIGHGTPYGTFWKHSTANDSVLGRVTLGFFPATVQTTPDGSLAFIANFNLHGEMVPSSVSVVATDDMLEIARITTCTMPHGSRINPQGTRQYSACMMDDAITEIDTRELAVVRHFLVGKGKEHGMPGPVAPAGHAAHGAAMGGAMPAMDTQCSPTWVQPSASGDRIFVACNKSNEIVEIDFASWRLTRRIPAGQGVYNLAVSPDGKWLVGTNKRGKSISIFDVTTGKEMAQIPTRTTSVHGVVVSPDSRYAFVTEEGRGSEPGILEVFDLQILKAVGSVELGQQAAGIDFFKVEPVR